MNETTEDRANRVFRCIDCDTVFDDEHADEFGPVDPGDLRHIPCWNADLDRGHVVEITS